MALAQSIVREIERVLEDFDGQARALTATLEVGRLRAVVPDALGFCFEVVSAGTRSEGTRLMIEEVPVHVRCPNCGVEREAEGLLFLCPVCGTPETVLKGKELVLRRLEIEEGG